MRKKGFTLIELLAVIVILAIVAIIALPMIMHIIEKAKKGSVQDSAYGILDSIELYYATNGLEENQTVMRFEKEGNGFYHGENQLKWKGTVPDKGYVEINQQGKTKLKIELNGYCAIKSFYEVEVSVYKGTCEASKFEAYQYEFVQNDALAIPAGTNVELVHKGEAIFRSSKESIAEVNEEGIVFINKEAEVGEVVTITMEQGENTYTLEIHISPEVKDDQYIIKSEKEMVWFQEHYKSGIVYTTNVTLEKDIDFSNREWEPIMEYEGVFDGGNHKIKNVSINREGEAGLLLNNIGTVKNVTIENSTIIGTTTVGGIAATNNGTIENCHIQNSVVKAEGAYTTYGGGITGFNYKLIQNCSNQSTVSVIETGDYRSHIGGIAGRSDGETAIIQQCYNKGDIYLETSAVTSTQIAYIGGIIGRTQLKAKIYECYNTGSVSSKGTVNSSVIGGIIGALSEYSVMDSCYNKGAVTFTGVASNLKIVLGGVAGTVNGSAQLKNSYNTGTLSAKNVSSTTRIGGCVSSLKTAGTVQGCYALSGVGTSSIYGEKDTASSITNSTMKTANELKNLTSTLGSKFQNDYKTPINDGYPILSFQ